MANGIKILVTGASGFVGSRLSLYLSSIGYDVYGLSRQGQGDEGVNWVVGDFCHEKQMRERLSDIQPSIIIHCAGVVRDSDDSDFDKVNYEGSKRLLELAQATPSVLGFINASSIGVYGKPQSDDGVVREDDECHPQSAYAISKYKFEGELFSQKSLPYINLRIANIPGADAFINYVINNKRASFYGDDWYVRDYIHPDDLNDLFKKSIGYLIKGEDSLTINAGAGIAYHFDDIVDEVERATGDKIERHFEPEKQGDIVKIICDIRRAKDALNWSPNHTRLQETIDYAVRNK